MQDYWGMARRAPGQRTYSTIPLSLFEISGQQCVERAWLEGHLDYCTVPTESGSVHSLSLSLGEFCTT